MQTQTSSKTLGVVGETLAFHYLKRQGYTILSRNYKCRLGEIDVVAKEGDVLSFVEVKTRTSDEKGSPAESVHQFKQRQITSVAKCYLQHHNCWDMPCRFDVVCVLMKQGQEANIELIRDAFCEVGR